MADEPLGAVIRCSCGVGTSWTAGAGGCAPTVTEPAREKAMCDDQVRRFFVIDVTPCVCSGLFTFRVPVAHSGDCRSRRDREPACLVLPTVPVFFFPFRSSEFFFFSGSSFPFRHLLARSSFCPAVKARSDPFCSGLSSKSSSPRRGPPSRALSLSGPSALQQQRSQTNLLACCRQRSTPVVWLIAPISLV